MIDTLVASPPISMMPYHGTVGINLYRPAISTLIGYIIWLLYPLGVPVYAPDRISLIRTSSLRS